MLIFFMDIYFILWSFMFHQKYLRSISTLLLTCCRIPELLTKKRISRAPRGTDVIDLKSHGNKDCFRRFVTHRI